MVPDTPGPAGTGGHRLILCFPSIEAAVVEWPSDSLRGARSGHLLAGRRAGGNMCGMMRQTWTCASALGAARRCLGFRHLAGRVVEITPHAPQGLSRLVSLSR